jgi:DNA-binding response OmpR family regulator
MKGSSGLFDIIPFTNVLHEVESVLDRMRYADLVLASVMRFKPIMMLTIESQQDKRDEAKQAGATGWLVKPVQPDELNNVVRKLLPL